MPPLMRVDVLGGEELPLFHDEVVDVGRNFIAAGEDVKRVPDDDGHDFKAERWDDGNDLVELSPRLRFVARIELQELFAGERM